MPTTRNIRRRNMKILMVLTSHDVLGNTGRKTGFWLEEFAAPYFVFREGSTKERPIMEHTESTGISCRQLLAMADV
jgi:hypothetical protein